LCWCGAGGCAGSELKADRELLMIAVEQDGSCLLHASEELKNDKELVLTAVGQKGIALAYASVRAACHPGVT
jgi:hypothetical protein